MYFAKTARTFLQEFYNGTKKLVLYYTEKSKKWNKKSIIDGVNRVSKPIKRQAR